jgi:hypothetical protein
LEVYRVRGRNIFWLTLIATLLGTPMIGGVSAPAMPTISIDPSLTTGKLPGDYFVVNLRVDDVVNLYAWEAELSFAPFANILVISDVAPGELQGDGFIACRYDRFASWLIVGGLLPASTSGSGNLATITFLVMEAGSSPLDLHDTTLADGDLNLISHNVVDGYYQGAEGNLRKVLGTAIGRKAPWKPGDAMDIKAQVVNNGWAPLYARLKFVSVRDDLKTTTLYSGQQYMSSLVTSIKYLYVNEHIPMFGGWATVGTSPYLNAPGDGSYIQGNDYCQLSDVFGFEDITLGPLEKIIEVRLEGYVKADSKDIDADVYVWDSFAWLGSLWGEASYAWKSPRWETRPVSTIVPATKTQVGLNAFQVLNHYWTETETSLGNFAMDSLRLKVTIESGGIVPLTPPYYVVNPGDPIDLPPAIWYILPADKGTYVTTVSVEYKYTAPDPRFPQVWITGDTILTFTWSVKA